MLRRLLIAYRLLVSIAFRTKEIFRGTMDTIRLDFEREYSKCNVRPICFSFYFEKKHHTHDIHHIILFDFIANLHFIIRNITLAFESYNLISIFYYVICNHAQLIHRLTLYVDDNGHVTFSASYER